MPMGMRIRKTTRKKATAEQKAILEKAYQRSNSLCSLSREDRLVLATRTGMEVKQVQNWFMNRRRKNRKEHGGGSPIVRASTPVIHTQESFFGDPLALLDPPEDSKPSPETLSLSLRQGLTPFTGYQTDHYHLPSSSSIQTTSYNLKPDPGVSISDHSRPSTGVSDHSRPGTVLLSYPSRLPSPCTSHSPSLTNSNTSFSPRFTADPQIEYAGLGGAGGGGGGGGGGCCCSDHFQHHHHHYLPTPEFSQHYIPSEMNPAYHPLEQQHLPTMASTTVTTTATSLPWAPYGLSLSSGFIVEPHVPSHAGGRGYRSYLS